MGRGGIALVFEKNCFSGLFLLHAQERDLSVPSGRDAVSAPRKHILAWLPVQTARPPVKPAITKEFLSEGSMNFTQGPALPAKLKTSRFLAGMLQLPQHTQVLLRLHPSKKAPLTAMQSLTLPPHVCLDLTQRRTRSY